MFNLGIMLYAYVIHHIVLFAFLLCSHFVSGCGKQKTIKNSLCQWPHSKDSFSHKLQDWKSKENTYTYSLYGYDDQL